MLTRGPRRHDDVTVARGLSDPEEAVSSAGEIVAARALEPASINIRYLYVDKLMRSRT